MFLVPWVDLKKEGPIIACIAYISNDVLLSPTPVIGIIGITYIAAYRLAVNFMSKLLIKTDEMVQHFIVQWNLS